MARQVTTDSDWLPTAHFGVLGAGYISDYHISGLQAAGAKVVSLFGRNAESVRKKADQYGISDSTTDPSTIFEREDIDGVVIATPDQTHEALTIAALQNGKSVLVQKPIARSEAEATRMIQAAESYDRLLCVSYMHRYFEEVRVLKQMLRVGTIGNVFFVRQRNATPGVDWASWQYKSEFVAGGVVMQLGIHGIDLLTQMFGPIEAVQAITARNCNRVTLFDGTVVESDIEDFATCLYRFKSGLTGTHEMMFNEVGGTDRFRMEVDGSMSSVWLRTGPDRLVSFTKSVAEEPGGQIIELPDEQPGKLQHEHFIAMMRNEAPNDNSAIDSLYGLRVANAIYQSSGSGSWEIVASE